MKKITKTLIECARELDNIIEKTSNFLDSKRMNVAYLNPDTLQKWVKDEWGYLLKNCADSETQKEFEAWIPEPVSNSHKDIIPVITAFIALYAVDPNRDFSRFVIYDDAETTITFLLAKYADALKQIQIEAKIKAHEAGETAQADAGHDVSNDAEKGNTVNADPDTAKNLNSAKTTISPLVPITASDCIKYIPRKYIVDGLIEDETITLFAGKEKIGKTYVLMNMALCMAAEKPWLGFETMGDAKGGILWLNLDMSRITTKRRINEVSNGIENKWNKKAPHLFDNFSLMDGQVFRDAGYIDSLQFFSDSDAVEGLKQFIIEKNIKVCFIDNLIQIEGDAQENSSNDIQKVFTKLKQLRDETHCSFIVIHHTTKNGGRGRGSSDIFTETDLNLQLNQCENKDQLLLEVDGARNTAAKDIGMRKNFPPRFDDGDLPMFDDNGHPICDFVLEKLDTDGLISEGVNKISKSKNTIEINITKILLMFHKSGNKPLTEYAVIENCKKDEECKLTGSKQTMQESVRKAYSDGKLCMNSVGQYYLADSQK